MTARLTMLALLVVTASNASSQQATFIYRLGRDTTAFETMARAGNRVTGEEVNRGGAAVTRLQYEVTLNAAGMPTAVVYRQRNAAGAVMPNAPSEIRLTFAGDSVRREAVFADSTSVRFMESP